MRNRSSFLFVGFWILGSGYWILDAGDWKGGFFLFSAVCLRHFCHLSSLSLLEKSDICNFVY